MSDNETNNADHCTSTPGTILRRCREFRGVSLKEAATATRVAEHHLSALEQDRTGEFANQAYLKGFLRIYCDYLGLNSDDMIRLSQRRYALAEGEAEGAPERKRSFRSVKRPFPWKKLILPTVLLFMMVATSLVLERPLPPRKALPPLPPPPAAVPVAAVQQVYSSMAPVLPAEESRAAAEAEQSPTRDEAQAEKTALHDGTTEAARGVVVHLRVIHNSSLAVTMDGTTTQHYDLTGGDSFEWKADRTIALELSSAGSVAVELNGRPISLGAGDVPVYVLLDAGGIRRQ